DAVDAPTTNYSIDRTVDVGEIGLPVSKGKIDAVIDDQSVGNILLANGLLSLQVGVVLNDADTALPVLEGAGVVGIAQQLAPCICALQDPRVPEVADVSCLECVVCGVAFARHCLQNALGV